MKHEPKINIIKADGLYKVICTISIPLKKKHKIFGRETTIGTTTKRTLKSSVLAEIAWQCGRMFKEISDDIGNYIKHGVEDCR